MNKPGDKKHKDLLARVDEFLNKSKRYATGPKAKRGKSRSTTPNKRQREKSASTPNVKKYDHLKFYQETEEKSERERPAAVPRNGIENLRLVIDSPSRIQSTQQESMVGAVREPSVADYSNLDPSEVERFNEEYSYLTDRFQNLKDNRLQLTKEQRAEIDHLEEYRNKLKSKIMIKSKNIDEIGSEVVKMEVELSKLVNRNKNLVIQNEEMRQKLYKLTELANDKEREMSIKIAQIQDELFESRAYYEQLIERIEYEKDKITEETRISYEESIDPIRQEYNFNQAEIESYKDQLRGIELSFQALKDDIVRDINVVEKRTVEDCGDELRLSVNEYNIRLEELERELRAFQSQYNDGARELELTQKKILETKIQYKNTLENLFGDKDYLESVIQQQKEAIQDLSKKRAYAEELLEKKIDEVEEDKKRMSERLDHMERQYEEVKNEGEKELEEFNTHLKLGKERIFKIEEAIQSFENECVIVKEKNRHMIKNLENGFQHVFTNNKNN